MKYNNNEVNNIKFNGADINVLKLNGVEVWRKSRLPEGYVEVEYIESTGKQYIDTQVSPTDNMRMDIVTYIDNVDKSLYICGSRESGGRISFAVDGSVSGFTVIGAINGVGYTAQTDGINWNRKTDGASLYTSYIESRNGLFDFYIKNETLNKVFETYNNSYRLLGDKPEKILLCAIRSNYINPGKTRVYSFSLKESGNQILNFIPCINNSNEVGMYDLISQQFFGNSGTGEFIAGPPIN